jgi:hypothetical protein
MERKGHDASFAARNSAQLMTIYSQVAARLGAWLIGALQEFWLIQRIADADQHPFLPRDISQKRIADVCALKQVMHQPICVDLSFQIGFGDRAIRNGQAAINRIRRPVRSAARIRRRSAIDVKGDRSGLPRKGVVVIIQRIPARVENCVVATQRRRSGSKFCVVCILEHGDSCRFARRASPNRGPDGSQVRGFAAPRKTLETCCRRSVDVETWSTVSTPHLNGN